MFQPWLSHSTHTVHIRVVNKTDDAGGPSRALDPPMRRREERIDATRNFRCPQEDQDFEGLALFSSLKGERIFTRETILTRSGGGGQEEKRNSN